WRFKTGKRIESSPVIGNTDTIYFGSYDGHLYAINPDGTEKWNFETGSWIIATPAIDENGTIYFGTRNGKFYALFN
ncbi:PQQ-binding-like beta-propeller repeat protein, partial [Methanococcus maripaludis]